MKLGKSLLTKSVGLATTVGSGFLSGGPLGAIRAGIGEVQRGIRTPGGIFGPPAIARIHLAPVGVGRMPPQPRLPQSGPMRQNTRAGFRDLPEFQGAAMQNGVCVTHPSCQPKCIPQRWNKSGYYVQTVPGQPELGGTWVAPESLLVRVRRRNLSNGRANTRALSRTVGLANQYKRLKKASRQLASACR